MRNTRNKKNSFNWNKVQRFSIRKLSFGVASCMIGAQFVLSGLNHTAKADGITAYEANGDKVTAYAHGESVYKLRGTSTSIYNAFWMDVDTSKYTKENPIIKVTLTYNAKDNQTGNAPIFWSGRPMHWFTVPEATEELGRDYKLSLTNGSGNTTEFSDWRSWESNSRFIHSKYKGNPDAWERYNTTTTEMLRKTPFVSLNSEFNKVLGDNNNRWYDNSNMPTQDIMRDLRAKSNSIYIDWEKRAAGTVTVSYTTKVKDPEKTKEITIGMGVYQPSNAQQYARVETIKLPVLYKLNEVFEPKEPERTAVGDITNLKDDEIAIIREKIWAANLNNTSTLLSTNNAFKDNLKDSSNSGANSIVIDRTTGKATIIYKDDTTDTIEGSNLIYKKPEPPKPVTPSTPTTDTVAADGLVTHRGLSFYTNPLEVDDLNKITPSQRNDARERFKKANLTSDGLSEYATYEGVSKSNLKAKVNFKIPDGPRNRASINFRGNGENFITLTNIKGGGILGTVPKEYLFKEKAKPAFDINAAKEEANNLIESLDNLYPKEKTDYKAAIANATDREGIEVEVNKAKAKANENAIKLAEMKKEANDKINGLNYLTKEERENAINKINSATIKQGDNNVDSAATNDKRDIDANRDDTRDRLNSVVNELVQQNLQKARQKAIETINSIPNEDLSSDKKTDYINKINAASKIGPASDEGTILNIVEKAQKEASAKEAARKKEEADKVRQQYKDMIANIPGLTDEEKTEYNKAIDAANNVGEMESIVEFAKLTGERKKAIAELGKLEYLNNNQKQSFIDAINDSGTKAELDYYVSQATQLNSKMKQLHDLAVEARKIKPENGAPQDKYTSAAADKQTAFNNALADAERVLNKATGADEAITSVGKLFTALETAINELKPSEKVTIPADKSALKAEYDKGDSVKNSPAYTKETNPDKKKAYDDALKEAKKVLDATDATQDAVDKALEDLEVAKAGLNGKQDEFALTKKDENAVAISIEPVKGEIVSKKEDKDLILGKIVGIPTDATVIYNPIVEKANKKYVPVKVTHENVSKEIEIEVIKDEVLNKPTTKVKVNNTNKLTEKEKEAVKNAVKKANPTLDENSITVNENGEVTVTYQTRPPKTIAASDTVEAGIASKVIPVVSTAKLSEVPKENGTIIKEADVQKVKDAVTVTVPTDQPQNVIKELVDGGKVVQGTNQSADGGADNTDKLVVKVKITYEDGSEDVVEVPVEGDTAAKTTPEVSTAKLSEVPKENGTITKEADVQKVKDAVKLPEVPKDQPQPTKELVDGGKVVQGTDQSGNGGANNTGKLGVKVEVKYPDGSKETVEVPVEGDTAAKTTPEVSTAKLSEVPKENGTITKEADVQKVKDAVKLPEVPKDQPQPTKELVDGGKVVQGTDQSGNGGANNAGKPVVKVEVTYGDGSKDVVEVPVEGTDAAKATPKVKEEITSGEVPVSVDPATDKKVAEADKKAIIEAVVVPEGQPQPTGKQVENDGAIVEGTGANAGKKVVVVEVTYPDGSKDEIEVPVRKATDKDKAKADLTKAADAEKAEIDEDNALSKKEKEALKAKVDELKAKHEENINNATSPEAIASATEKGRQEIAAVHTPQDITETAKRKLTPPKEKVKVTDINHLTNEEKDAVEKAIVAANPQLEESEVYVDDQGNVASPKGYLEAEKVVTQALNKPATPVVVADPNHLSDEEKAAVKKAVADANPGLKKDDITVDDKGNVTTKNGDKLLAKDVVTPALKKPTTPVVVGNPNALTDKEKEDIKDAVVAANPGLNKGDVKVDNQGNVETPKGNLPKEDVVTTPLNKPNKLVEVENPNSLTVKEKETVKEAVVNANPGLDKKDIKVDDQGNVETPKGNLSAKDVVTSTLKKPTTPVEVVNPAKLTDQEKAKVVEEIIKNNPGLTDKDIKVDDQGNVETPKGNLPSEDVVTPALKKPTKPVEVKDPNNLTDKEKEDVKKAVIEANKDANGQPTLNGDQVTVNNDGSVTTPKGNLQSGDVVTPALKKPTKPVEVKDPNNLTDKEKEDVKKAVIEANKDANGQPTLSGDQVTVNNDGSVTTPKGNLPSEDVVKTKVETAKGAALKFDIPELSYQDAVVAGVVAVEKGNELTDKDILTQLALGEGAVTAKVISKPATTETGTKEAEVEVTLADGRKVTVKVSVVVYEGERPEVNDLAKAKEDARKQVEEAAKTKIDEIKNNKELSAEQKQKAEDAINKAKEAADKAINEATSAGTAKAIGDEAAKNIAEFKPEQDSVKPVDPSKLDEEKAKAIAEIEQAAKDQIDAIKNNKDLTPLQKEEAIKEIEDLKVKAIENVRKVTTKEEVAKVVNDVEKAIKKVDPQPILTPQPGNNGGNGSNQNAQANSDAVEYAQQAAKNILEEAARAKKAQLEEAGLSDAEKEELFAKVDAEKQAALDEIAKAKDVDTVKQLVTKAVAKIKAIQPARNAQDNQGSQDAQNAQNAQNAQDAQNHSNPTSLDAANVRGQELPATGTGSEFVVFNAAAISILTGLGLAIPSKKKETEK